MDIEQTKFDSINSNRELIRIETENKVNQIAEIECYQ